VREALGGDLPDAQAARLRRILADRDEVQYGSSLGRYSEAERMLSDLEAFAAWTERRLVGTA